MELDTKLVAVISCMVFLWSLVSARAARIGISGPIAFVAVGLFVANHPMSLIHVDIHSDALRSIAELSLTLLLFSDASRVDLRELRSDAAIPSRLLFIGLPLTIALGTGIAALVFHGLNPWAAAVIAAAVAPTDAALGAQVVEDPHVPKRIRTVLGVESGLNDGIATQFVTFFVAGAVADEVAHSTTTLASALGDLGIGILTGAVLGLIGGFLLRLAQRAKWSQASNRSIFVLALALLSYSLSIEFGGNGFIAAFVGGLAFGKLLTDDVREQTIDFDAKVGELLSLVVWFMFGAVMVTALDAVTWRTVVFAVLALTLIRMLPVALALLGSHLDRTTVAFVGWFGPRGLATIVFGLLAADDMVGPDARVVLAAITLTVLLSVIAHGVTASPLARRYGAHAGEIPAGIAIAD